MTRRVPSWKMLGTRLAWRLHCLSTLLFLRIMGHRPIVEAWETPSNHVRAFPAKGLLWSRASASWFIPLKEPSLASLPANSSTLAAKISGRAHRARYPWKTGNYSIPFTSTGTLRSSPNGAFSRSPLFLTPILGTYVVLPHATNLHVGEPISRTTDVV